MIQVRCEGCQATFELDERRMPKNGMRVRCPKCGASFHVSPTGETSSVAAAAAPVARPVVPPPPVSDPLAFGELDFGVPDPSMELDLPTPVASRAVVDLPANVTPKGLVDLPATVAGPRPGLVDLPRAAAPRPPPPPPPRVASPSVTPVDLIDLPATARGVIDLPAMAKGFEADLPARAAPKPAARAELPALARPAPREPAPPPKPPARREVAPMPSADSFGELSLPMAAVSPKRDPAAAAKLDFDSLDEPPLPAVRAAASAAVTTDALDDPFARSGAAMPTDLPTPARVADLPAPARVADLPAPARVADLPATKEVTADLPATASPGLPATAKRALGRVALEKRAVPAASLAGAVEADLPMPASGIGLPQTATASLPANVARGDLPASASLEGLPRTARADAFGEIDLPALDARERGAHSAPDALDFDLAPPLPTPLAPPKLAGSSGEFDLSLEPPGAKPAAAPEPASRGKAPADDAGRTVRGRAGGTGFGEVDLGGDEPVASGGDALGGEFDDIRLSDAKGAEVGAVGASVVPEIDVGVARSKDVERARRERPLPAEAGAKPTARRGLYVALGIAGAVIIAGASLSLTSAGPFGATLIDEQINGPARHVAAQHTIAAAGRQLELDTWGQARRALASLDAQLGRTPNEPALIAYDAYAHYLVLARFGNDPAVAGRARTLFDQLTARARAAPYASAARAARDLVNGRADHVHVANNDASTRDLGTLAALIGNDPQAAVETARAAEENHPTPRARYLYARALYVADDLAGAREQAQALLDAQPGHAGARLVLARVLASRADGRDRAVEIAREVEGMNQDASTGERTDAAVLVGQTELARDHVTAARQAFERALVLDPRSADALVGSGRILYAASQFDDALARFQAAETADADDVDAKVGYAMTSLALGRAADARTTLDPLLHDHGDNASVHYWLAKALNAMNQPADAEREFREAIRLENTNLDAYTTLAALLFSQQRPEAAEQVLEEARAHVSDQTAIHRALGEQRAARGDLPGAERELRQAVAGRADDLRSHFLLGQVLRRENHFDDAVRELEAVARVDAAYPGLSLERGTLAEARGDAPGALAMFRAALSRDPQNADLTVRVASALVATGSFADADTQMSRFVIDHPNDAEAQYVLGRAKLGEGDTADALRMLERATELDATRADFHAYAAEVNLARASYPLALRHASSAIAIDPNYARGYWVRGEVESRQGAVREALVDANRALQLDPNMAEAMVTLADADDGLGHVPEAIILYHRALSLRPNMGEWHARLGRLLSEQGHGGDAVAELERATSLGDPQNPPPAWLAPAHRQLGDILRDSSAARARQHYQRFLDLSPPNGSGTAEVRSAMSELGR